ncbi:MAG TPA: lactate racemase domain-containing protein, partial [Planctomycetota bacterium]|nr:lactate racemase domain-containing protein [Planctomycetota bacterium]
MIVQKTSETFLGADAIREVTAEALAKRDLAAKRVLVIIPDHTRTAPLPMLFRMLFDLLAPKVKKLDYLVALGTHPPMSDDQINRLIGVTPAERAGKYAAVDVYNHLWKDPQHLRQIGVITADEIAAQTGGKMRESVPVILNKLIFDYDHLLIVCPVFPHEVAGFSGGHKYLFPGIAAQEIIDFTHWLGAVNTNPVIIGNRDTPVRWVIERAASFVKVPRTCLAFVVGSSPAGECGAAEDAQDEPGLTDRELCKAPVVGLFVGDVLEAWRAASAFSAKHHILYVDKPFKQVLSCAPPMYDDIWTAGKCMYKLEPVLADDAELIIYAPHVTEVSYTHGKILDEVGYHVRDYFLKQWDKFKDYPRGVLAHATHVKGIGTYEDGVETPRVNVVLATGIPEERCRRINLGYRDPATVDVESFANREDEGVLLVRKAGEHLYRLKDGSIPRIPG